MPGSPLGNENERTYPYGKDQNLLTQCCGLTLRGNAPELYMKIICGSLLNMAEEHAAEVHTGAMLRQATAMYWGCSPQRVAHEAAARVGVQQPSTYSDNTTHCV